MISASDEFFLSKQIRCNTFVSTVSSSSIVQQNSNGKHALPAEDDSKKVGNKKTKA